MREIRERPSRNMYKGHMDKAEGGMFRGGRWGLVGQRGVAGGKWIQLYFKTIQKKRKKLKKENGRDNLSSSNTKRFF